MRAFEKKTISFLVVLLLSDGACVDLVLDSPFDLEVRPLDYAYTDRTKPRTDTLLEPMVAGILMSTWQAFAAHQPRHEAGTTRLAESEPRQTALSLPDRAEDNTLQNQRNQYAADIKAI